MNKKKLRVNLQIPPDMLTRLSEVARQEHKRVSALVRSYIKLGLMYSEGKIKIYSVNEDGSHSETHVVL